jgi:hypothetical protein
MRAISRVFLTVPLRGALTAPFSNYKYPYNINREENANYLKKVEKAEHLLEDAHRRSAIPRRQRRVYDKPKHDLDITNYVAWRIYEPEEMLFKFWAHGSTVDAKLYLQPKWVIHAFGIGLLPLNHEKSVSLEFSFEDNNFSKYLLYEYRNTTKYARNVEGYDYANQNHLPEKRRKRQRLTP